MTSYFKNLITYIILLICGVVLIFLIFDSVVKAIDKCIENSKPKRLKATHCIVLSKSPKDFFRYNTLCIQCGDNVKYVNVFDIDYIKYNVGDTIK